MLRRIGKPDQGMPRRPGCSPVRRVIGLRVSAAPWGAYLDGVAGLHVHACTGRQLLLRSVRANDQVLAGRSRCAACQAKGRHAAAIGQDACLHRFEEADAADDAVASVPLACAARTAPDRKPFEHDGKAAFQYFRIGQARIRHVGLHRIGPVEPASVGDRSGTRTTRDSLVILVTRIAEGQVVHHPLRSGKRAQRAEDRVGHDLAGLDISGDDGGWGLRVQHRPVGHDQPDRRKAAFVHRDIAVDHRADGVEHRCLDDGNGRVEIPRVLSAGAGQVEQSFLGIAVDRDGKPDDGPVVHLVGKAAVVQPVQQGAHRFLGLCHDVAHVRIDHDPRLRIRQTVQLAGPLDAGGQLRLEIGDVAVGIARRMGPGPQHLAHLRLAEASFGNQ